MGNNDPIKRRKVLKGSVGALVTGVSVSTLGTTSAYAGETSAVISLRGHTIDPISAENVKKEIENKKEQFEKELGNKKVDYLIESNHFDQNFQQYEDIVAFNLIAKNGKTSTYVGRSVQINEGKSKITIISNKDKSIERVYQRANNHLSSSQETVSQISTTANSNFESISDYNLDVDLQDEVDQPVSGAAQLSISVDEHKDDSDVVTVQTRADQRAGDVEGACETHISNRDRDITHNYHPGMDLYNWSPNPSNEDNQSSSSTLSLSIPDISAAYSYTYSHSDGITVSDESPFEDDTAKANISMPTGNYWQMPNRIRASSASIGKVEDAILPSIGIKWEPEWYVLDYYSGRCMYESYSEKLVSTHSL